MALYAGDWRSLMNCETIKGLCNEYTNLSQADVEILEVMALQIPYTAELR